MWNSEINYRASPEEEPSSNILRPIGFRRRRKRADTICPATTTSLYCKKKKKKKKIIEHSDISIILFRVHYIIIIFFFVVGTYVRNNNCYYCYYFFFYRAPGTAACPSIWRGFSASRWFDAGCVFHQNRHSPVITPILPDRPSVTSFR